MPKVGHQVPGRLSVREMYALDQQAQQGATGEQEYLNRMLFELVEKGGSDLHLTVGAPPTIRVNGSLRPLPGYGRLTAADTAMLARAAVTEVLGMLRAPDTARAQT